MKQVILFVSVLACGFLASCSNTPKRKVAGGNAPNNAEADTDGRIKTRGNSENRKRNEYYNNIQHR